MGRTETSAPRTAAQGLVAGALATIPMSMVMLVAGRSGAMGTQPPERLTEEALGRAGVDRTTEGEQNVAASLAHLSFGAGGGAAFALLHRRLSLPLPHVAQGVAFGLAVWAVSYQGWIPALGIVPPADDDRPGRRRAMIAAHVVYGSVLGAVEARLFLGQGRLFHHRRRPEELVHDPGVAGGRHGHACRQQALGQFLALVAPRVALGGDDHGRGRPVRSSTEAPTSEIRRTAR